MVCLSVFIHVHASASVSSGVHVWLFTKYQLSIIVDNCWLNYPTKKEGLSPDNPIFINLKSNTMKNTMQKYCKFSIYANICAKNMFYNIKYRCFASPIWQMDGQRFEKVSFCRQNGNMADKMKDGMRNSCLEVAKWIILRLLRQNFAPIVCINGIYVVPLQPNPTDASGDCAFSNLR